MRIFRYLDQSGKMGFGRFDEEGNTFLILQKGDGDFEATDQKITPFQLCLLYTSPSPRDGLLSRMPSSA